VYLRIALGRGGDEPYRDGEAPALRQALVVLAGQTTTPERGYAAVWEGWTSRGAAPVAPRVVIPNRVMLLFTGPVAVLRDAPALAWYGCSTGSLEEPHIVWPADRAWCVACEVDEEIEFSVGCSNVAALALEEALPGAVRRVAYGAEAPMYRE